MTPDGEAEAIGLILLAMLKGPSTGVHTHTYAPDRYDEYTDCPACGTRWDDCEASQPYAIEEDPACCDGCEHKWVGPPPTYTITEITDD